MPIVLYNETVEKWLARQVEPRFERNRPRPVIRRGKQTRGISGYFEGRGGDCSRNGAEMTGITSPSSIFLQSQNFYTNKKRAPDVIEALFLFIILRLRACTRAFLFP